MTSQPMSVFPFWVALALGVGSLLCYLTFAALVRTSSDDEGPKTRIFNLGLPPGQDYRQLFGISIAAAGTPLSTVVAFFFLNGGTLGARMFVCPLFFSVGIYASFWVYCQARTNGYFQTEHSRGREALIPYLCRQLTGSTALGRFVLVLCTLPLLGLLTLEVAFGTHIIRYIAKGAFPSAPGAPNGLSAGVIGFLVFTMFMILLLGYVFVGGFRAVLRSDVWQYKLICTAVVATLASLILFSLNNYSQLQWKLHWDLLWPHLTGNPLRFYVPFVFVNLILPIGLASSWQRYCAFDAVGIDMQSALISGLKRTISLWLGLIAVALGFATFGFSKGDTLSALFNGIQARGDWWQVFLFPLLAVAALSAMYSCSDTCVSALLYVIDYAEPEGGEKQTQRRLPRRYYWAMALIFSATLASYWALSSRYQDISSSPLFAIAVAVYASVCVIAPTLFLTTVLPPAASPSDSTRRTHYVTASLLIGLVAFWGCTIGFWTKPVWSQCAVLPALLLSALGCGLLYRQERRTLRSQFHGWRIHRSLDTRASGQNRAF
ncbi:MAG TPA: hypothetical protein VMH05_17415 [Bryobacteraceae bacterium]|nr:hypothetical protein [Bryobacteraceae bacterium]